MDYGSKTTKLKRREVRTSMLTYHEIDRLKALLEQMPDHQAHKKPQIDVSNRSRDEKGRFLPNEFHSNQKEELSPGHRSVKIVKIKGSYNSYLIKDVWLSDVDKEILLVLGIFGLLAIIF